MSVKKLEPGSVVFEDISEERYKGHIIKAVNSKPALNNSMDGHFTGMIEYQGEKDTHEVLFGDRDMEDDIILQKGDVVEFNVSTGTSIILLFIEMLLSHKNLQLNSLKMKWENRSNLTR